MRSGGPKPSESLEVERREGEPLENPIMSGTDYTAIGKEAYRPWMKPRWTAGRRRVEGAQGAAESFRQIAGRLLGLSIPAPGGQCNPGSSFTTIPSVLRPAQRLLRAAGFVSSMSGTKNYFRLYRPAPAPHGLPAGTMRSWLRLYGPELSRRFRRDLPRPAAAL